MGRLLLIILAAIAVFMIVSLVISALHFVFWIAVVALIVVAALRLTAGRRARR
jgi:membrane protein implicated in regulation of membrane protease activity